MQLGGGGLVKLLVLCFSLIISSLTQALPQKEMDCLSLVGYKEARGESDKGMVAVMQVVLNRAKSGKFPSTPCEVIRQRGQFQWHAKDRSVRDKEAYVRAKKIAKEVIQGKYKDFTGNATYFHANSVKPSWTKKMNCTIKIGNHLYYKPIK